MDSSVDYVFSTRSPDEGPQKGSHLPCMDPLFAKLTDLIEEAEQARETILDKMKTITESLNNMERRMDSVLTGPGINAEARPECVSILGLIRDLLEMLNEVEVEVVETETPPPLSPEQVAAQEAGPGRKVKRARRPEVD